MTLADEKYVALTTYRRSGEPVSTPVWVVQISDGRLGIWTAADSGKVKRLRNDSRVTAQASDLRGRVRAGTTPLNGTAEEVRSGRWYDEVHRRLDEKYGLLARATKLAGRLRRRGASGRTHDAVILVRLDG
jgi:PPOX class probable F420-dependent enzyme